MKLIKACVVQTIQQQHLIENKNLPVVSIYEIILFLNVEWANTALVHTRLPSVSVYFEQCRTFISILTLVRAPIYYLLVTGCPFLPQIRPLFCLSIRCTLFIQSIAHSYVVCGKYWSERKLYSAEHYWVRAVLKRKISVNSMWHKCHSEAHWANSKQISHLVYAKARMVWTCGKQFRNWYVQRNITLKRIRRLFYCSVQKWVPSLIFCVYRLLPLLTSTE